MFGRYEHVFFLVPEEGVHRVQDLWIGPPVAQVISPATLLYLAGQVMKVVGDCSQKYGPYYVASSRPLVSCEIAEVLADPELRRLAYWWSPLQ